MKAKSIFLVKSNDKFVDVWASVAGAQSSIRIDKLQNASIVETEDGPVAIVHSVEYKGKKVFKLELFTQFTEMNKPRLIRNENLEIVIKKAQSIYPNVIFIYK